MLATKWYRRAGAETQYRGRLDAGRMTDGTFVLWLTENRDRPERLKVLLTRDEARTLRDTLNHALREDS